MPWLCNKCVYVCGFYGLWMIDYGYGLCYRTCIQSLWLKNDLRNKLITLKVRKMTKLIHSPNLLGF